jgi:hypothetical protein
MDLGNSMEQRLKATKQIPMQGPAYWLIHVKLLSLIFLSFFDLSAADSFT